MTLSAAATILTLTLAFGLFSTPVAWDEIDDEIRGTHFNLRNVPARIAKQRKDPWADYWTVKQSLTKAMIKDMRERMPGNES